MIGRTGGAYDGVVTRINDATYMAPIDSGKGELGHPAQWQQVGPGPSTSSHSNPWSELTGTEGEWPRYLSSDGVAYDRHGS
jgi:hypothetical protein